MHYLYNSRESLTDAPRTPPFQGVPEAVVLTAGDANNVPDSAAEQGVIAAGSTGKE
jgi:hypothetical protein